MAKVSIIVSVNTEYNLKQCLDSLVVQTLNDIQIVIINFGTTEPSASIIQQYCDKYPEKIVAVTKENGGQGAARNFGLQYCTGEYIGFMDSDDYARSDMYEKLYNAARQNNADYAACAYTEFYTVNEQTKIITEYVIKPRRAGDIAACYADPSKAKKELGWEAALGIDEMCASLWNWQKKNPDGYKT